jgi:putative glycosyltransferase (TIGR04348 family)
MRRDVAIVTPAPRGSRKGNRVTTLRWAKRLRELGCRVRVFEQWSGEPCDLLVALHAKRSHASLVRHARACPHAPRVLALTGTDLYGDIHADADAQESLELATRLILLQPLGIRQLPRRLSHKACTIRQSARAPSRLLRQPEDLFTICVLGHLREVKDPFLAARAVRLLPSGSRVRVLHLGAALNELQRAHALEEEAQSAGRWRWLGERPRAEALRILGGSQLLALTSLQEGGANVVTEAIACGIPVVSSRIEGSLGILGGDYPGYFEVRDAAGLAALLRRCETDPACYAALRTHCERLRPLVEPACEREAWARLLAELLPRGETRGHAQQC